MKTRVVVLARTKAPTIVAGALLAFAALSACSNSSGESVPGSAPISASPSTTLDVLPSTATSAPSVAESATTQEDIDSNADYITTMNISPKDLENAIASMDLYTTIDETSADGYINGIYAAYVPDALGPNGMCISRTEAQAEANARSRQMKLLEDLKGTVPEELYNQNNSYYWHSKRLEDQTEALLANAALDDDCPVGSNTQSVTFEFNGQQYTTDAAHTLLYTRGAGAFRANPGAYSQDLKRGQAAAFGKTQNSGEADFPTYVLMQSQKIIAEEMLSLLEYYDLP